MINVPAIINDDKMPVTTAHERKLKDFNLIHRQPDDLIDPDILDKISTEVETTALPADKDDVSKWAKLLVGAYPSNQIQDPDIYVRSLLYDLSGFPEDIIEVAIHKVRRTCKWLPTCSEVHEACLYEMREIDFLRTLIRLQLTAHKDQKERKE